MLRTPTEADPELFDQDALEEGDGGGVEDDEIEETGQQGGEMEGDAEEANLGGSLEEGGEKKDIAAGARGSLLVVEEDDGQIIKRCTVYPRVLHWSKVSVKIFPTGSGLKKKKKKQEGDCCLHVQLTDSPSPSSSSAQAVAFKWNKGVGTLGGLRSRIDGLAKLYGWLQEECAQDEDALCGYRCVWVRM